ncbi:hypothetical protein PG989_007734 [Apiospora arundinis]|uniref:Uncharacterized protein n=1 Tax=Apiospora arundinis TaxID=335852 RepID=A0ABR2J487_9PEZI
MGVIMMGALTVAAVHYQNDIVRIANQTHNDMRDYLNQPASPAEAVETLGAQNSCAEPLGYIRDLVPVNLRNLFVGRGAT